jgi:hypothetical protein
VRSGEKSKSMKNILKAITPLRRRIHFNRAIAILATGLVISAGISLILAFISIVMPIPFLFKKVVSIYLIFTVSSIITSLLLRPGLLHTLKIGDRLGLDERLVTAYYYMDDNSPLSQLQVKDTLETVKKKDFKRLYPLKFPIREFLIFLGLTLLVAATSIIPSSAKEKAVVMENTLKEIETQTEKIDKEKDEILPEHELVAEEIEQLLKELKHAQNEEDAIKALSITRNKLEEKLEELIEKGQDGEGLEGSEEISDGLEKKSEKKLDKELEKKLGDLIASLDNSKNKIADTAGRNNINLAQMDKLGNKGQQGQGDKGENSSGDGSNAGRNGSTDNHSTGNQGGTGNDAGSTGKSGSQSESGSRSEGESGSNQTGMNGSSEGTGQSTGQNSGESAGQVAGEGTGQSDGEGSSQGIGQGSNNGQGNGEGTGQGAGEGSGDDVGEGSNSGLEGYNGENSDNVSAGREPGEKKSKDYEMVYIPKRLGGDTKASSVKGSMSDSGDSIRYDAEGAPVEKGYMLPYNEVLQQYKDEAVTGIENHPVPPGMKEIVRDYFSSLE